MRRKLATFGGLSTMAFITAFVIASTLFVPSALAVGEKCSATQKCPQSSPCCSSAGTCGGGAVQCTGGCQAWASFSADSCVANPICQNKNLTFAPSDYNNPHKFWPILLFNGNASNAPFTLDYGSLGQGPQGVLLELTEQSQTRLSTTDYMLYGNVQLTARHAPMTGLVFAFITMSDTKDEIDWEFTTSDPNDLQTNFFSQGEISKGTAETLQNQSSTDVNDWHTYGLNWQADKLQWTVDGKVVRSVSRTKAGEEYPRSPSRIQVSVWAGGNATNPPGVIDWSGGPIDWTQSQYQQQGFYSVEISSFVQTCASPSDANLTTQGAGTNGVTSWKYTGAQSSSLGMPEFVLSTDPLTYVQNPGLDGPVGMPGYAVQSAFTKSNKNAWDGSGDTSNLPKSVVEGSSRGSDSGNGSSSGSGGGSSSSSTNSGGWLANNRTLSIAVPVVGAVAVVALLWGLAVCTWRKMRRANGAPKTGSNDSNAHLHGISGGLSSSGQQMTSFSNTAPVTSKGRGGVRDGGRTSDYHALQAEDEDLEEDEYSLARGAAPMGAQKIGKGLGPAVGPRPGAMNSRRDHRGDASSSGHTTSSYEASRDEYDLGAGHRAGYASYVQRAHDPVRQSLPRGRQVPSTTQMNSNQQAVRGPYTPGMNVFTPAVQQTPAMRGVFAAPSPYPQRQGFQPPPPSQHLSSRQAQSARFQSSPERNPYAAAAVSYPQAQQQRRPLPQHQTYQPYLPYGQ